MLLVHDVQFMISFEWCVGGCVFCALPRSISGQILTLLCLIICLLVCLECEKLHFRLSHLQYTMPNTGKERYVCGFSNLECTFADPAYIQTWLLYRPMLLHSVACVLYVHCAPACVFMNGLLDRDNAVFRTFF